MYENFSELQILYINKGYFSQNKGEGKPAASAAALHGLETCKPKVLFSWCRLLTVLILYVRITAAKARQYVSIIGQNWDD